MAHIPQPANDLPSSTLTIAKLAAEIDTGNKLTPESKEIIDSGSKLSAKPAVGLLPPN